MFLLPRKPLYFGRYYDVMLFIKSLRLYILYARARDSCIITMRACAMGKAITCIVLSGRLSLQKLPDLKLQASR